VPRAATGVQDPRALVELLWAPSTAVGRSGATIGSIVDAAIEIADADGLAALTMRGLADRVGVGAMTLYGYVPGKSELLELMVDRFSGTLYDGHPQPAEVGDWRAGLEHIACRIYEHGLAHGWALEIEPARPVIGPGVALTYEAELAVVDGIGLDDHEMDHVVTVVRALASSSARWQLGLQEVRTASGLSDHQWWDEIGPALAVAVADTPLPLAGRVGSTVASAGDPRGSLELGIRMLLDGLAARIG
jgi:AcrR family transcriptional regulator